MSTSYSANLKLGKPAIADTGWGPVITGDLDSLDALAPVGSLAVSTHEQPSTTLHVDIAAGSFVKQDGSIGTYAGVSNQAIGTGLTRVLYLDGASSWTLTVAAAYPSTPHIRLATVVAGATTIMSVTDDRQCFPVAGSIADGTVLTLGTTTGLKIGGGASEKLGFFGKTPIVRPTMGSATAGGSYTATEQGMLQAVYDAVRSLGLGS
jgi:hypothetical protein